MEPTSTEQGTSTGQPAGYPEDGGCVDTEGLALDFLPVDEVLVVVGAAQIGKLVGNSDHAAATGPNVRVVDANLALYLLALDDLVHELERNFKLDVEPGEFFDGGDLHSPRLAYGLDLTAAEADIDIALLRLIEVDVRNDGPAFALDSAQVPVRVNRLCQPEEFVGFGDVRGNEKGRKY